MLYLIVLLVAGLYFLISGKVRYNKILYIEGTKARIAGLIFLAPLGLVLLALVVMTILESAGKITDTKTFEQTINGFANSTAINGLMIGLAYINFYSVSREIKTRSGCLTYWLIFTIFGILSLLWFMRNIISNTQFFKIASIGIAIFQIISLVGIWLWKKWGVFSYVAFTLLSPIVAFFRVESILQVFISFIGSLSFILILYLLVKPKWQFFE